MGKPFNCLAAYVVDSCRFATQPQVGWVTRHSRMEIWLRLRRAGKIHAIRGSLKSSQKNKKSHDCKSRNQTHRCLISDLCSSVSICGFPFFCFALVAASPRWDHCCIRSFVIDSSFVIRHFNPLCSPACLRLRTSSSGYSLMGIPNFRTFCSRRQPLVTSCSRNRTSWESR